jgi:hypothetical protein
MRPFRIQRHAASEYEGGNCEQFADVEALAQHSRSLRFARLKIGLAMSWRCYFLACFGTIIAGKHVCINCLSRKTSKL